MKEQLRNALVFPRVLFRQMIELHACPHAGHFAEEERGCWACDQEILCQWLYRNDECAPVERRGLGDIVESLESAITIVAAQVEAGDHGRQVCRCELCFWLRDTENLIAEAYNALCRERNENPGVPSVSRVLEFDKGH